MILAVPKGYLICCLIHLKLDTPPDKLWLAFLPTVQNHSRYIYRENLKVSSLKF